MLAEPSRPWAAVIRAQELLLRVAGVLERRRFVEHTGEVGVRYVHQLDIGRRLDPPEMD